MSPSNHQRNRGGHWAGAGAGLLVMMLATTAVAVPLAGDPVTLVQPDGKQFVAVPGGDEWMNWVTHEGTLIVQDERGWWRYARVQNGTVHPTSTIVGRANPPRSAAATDEIAALAASAVRPREAVAPEPAPARTDGRTNRAVLVVLVEFTDQTFASTDAYWQSLVFGATGKTVRTYYDEVSAGAITITPAAETYGSANDGVVRVQLNYAHPNPGSTILDANRWITHDALVAADGVVNWAVLDTDSDGFLEANECHLVIVVAGHEAGRGPGYSPSVIGHRWALGFTSQPPQGGQYVPAPLLDGVSLGDYTAYAGYCQVGELHYTYPGTIGVPCHELGHDMGLPDLYDYTLMSDGIGGHGLMGYGCWGQAAGDANLGETPVHMCAWSKVQVGFVTETIASGNQDYTLMAAGLPGYNVIRVNTLDVNQYFLLENRQPFDALLASYDDGLYRWFSMTSGGVGGGGLAVWHIDESMPDQSNVQRKRVDLEEANEGLLGWSELDFRPPYPQDPTPYQGNRHHYYYASHVDTLHDQTTPSTKLYNGSRNYTSMTSVSAGAPAMKCFVALQPTTRAVEWITLLGGWQRDSAFAVAVDAMGNATVAGGTNSGDFPTTPGAYQTSVIGYGALFVTQFDAAGNLLRSTLFNTPGSSYAPTLYDVTLDNAGSPYLTGVAYEGLPTTAGAYDMTYNGGYSGSTWGDGYVTKFDASLSSLAYCTYVGGAAYDASWGIDVDSSGNAYLAGVTNSSNFPATLGSYGNSDIFVAKLNAAGSNLTYSRLMGAQWGTAKAVVVDGSGEAHITGEIYTNTLPVTTGAFDTTQSGSGYADAFMMRLDANGYTAYGTYLGGYHTDRARDLSLDANGYVTIVGDTGAADFPTTAGVVGPSPFGRSDVFVTRLHPTAYSGLDYSTYLGGPENDFCWGLCCAADGSAHVAGYEQFTDQDSNEGHVMTLRGDATAVDYAEYFGGLQRDEATDIARDPHGAFYVVGFTESSDFGTTPGAFDTTMDGASDGWVARVGWTPMLASMVVNVPDGGEVWRIGRQQTITWTSSGTVAYVVIELSRNGTAGPWETLYAMADNDGSETWTVTGPAASNCVIRITDYSTASLTDMSNGGFAIAVQGDLDGDGDIDFGDVAHMMQCMVGAGNSIAPPLPGQPDCGNSDLDDDGDVDLKDLAILQQAFTG
jgi:M6 family metalloprotease-like protein